MYNIETLAKQAGLTRRTIRYYVQRGLLHPPQGGGRGSYYTETHLEQLKKIQKWSQQGVPLIHMKTMQVGKVEQTQADSDTGIQTTACEKCTISEGIELIFRPGRLCYEDLFQIQVFIEDLLRRKNNVG